MRHGLGGARRAWFPEEATFCAQAVARQSSERVWGRSWSACLELKDQGTGEAGGVDCGQSSRSLMSPAGSLSENSGGGQRGLSRQETG